MNTSPPVLLTSWSIRPQGLPKYTFSAHWPIRAMSGAVRLFPANRALPMRPSSTSKAALLERPEPGSTSDSTHASKPCQRMPRRAKAAAMPRTRAAVVFRSSCRGDRSSGASSTGAYPRENTRTTPSPVGRTRARAVRSMAAASTQPC